MTLKIGYILNDGLFSTQLKKDPPLPVCSVIQNMTD